MKTNGQTDEIGPRISGPLRISLIRVFFIANRIWNHILGNIHKEKRATAEESDEWVVDQLETNITIFLCTRCREEMMVTSSIERYELLILLMRNKAP